MGVGGIPSDYFVSTQLQLWLFVVRVVVVVCWAVTIGLCTSYNTQTNVVRIC